MVRIMDDELPTWSNGTCSTHQYSRTFGDEVEQKDYLPCGRPMGGLIPPSGRGGMAVGIAGTAADTMG